LSGHTPWGKIRRSDPTLARAAWSEAQFEAYADAAERLCKCEGLCDCHWDDPDSLAMLKIETMDE